MPPACRRCSRSTDRTRDGYWPQKHRSHSLSPWAPGRGEVGGYRQWRCNTQKLWKSVQIRSRKSVDGTVVACMRKDLSTAGEGDDQVFIRSTGRHGIGWNTAEEEEEADQLMTIYNLPFTSLCVSKHSCYRSSSRPPSPRWEPRDHCTCPLHSLHHHWELWLFLQCPPLCPSGMTSREENPGKEWMAYLSRVKPSRSCSSLKVYRLVCQYFCEGDEIYRT